jgi:hypothetical protein
MAAVDEIAKNPEAMKKYKGNRKVCVSRALSPLVLLWQGLLTCQLRAYDKASSNPLTTVCTHAAG